MSNTDKTRDALLSTMVKTKTGTQANEAPAETTAKKSATPAATKPVTQKKVASKKKAVAKKAPARKAAEKSGPAADPFQSKGRVWPD
jgi:hypothetical protein